MFEPVVTLNTFRARQATQKIFSLGYAFASRNHTDIHAVSLNTHRYAELFDGHTKMRYTVSQKF